MNTIKRFALSLLSTLLIFSAISPLSLAGNVNAEESNLITNPSVETNSSNMPTSWLEGNWGTNQANFSYLNTGHTGSHSVEVQMSSYSNGDAKWYFTPVNVTGSTEYTYSDFYESNVNTDVVVQYSDASGNYSYQDLGEVAPSSSWQPVTDNFTTPAGTTSLTVFHLINSVGYLTTDDFSLTENTAPSVTITSPTANATVTGKATLSASANAVDGLSSVQFMLDGQAIGSPVTASPYSLSWDSSTVTNGTHSLTAVATGNDGTMSVSTPVLINVSNAVTAGGNIIPNADLSAADPNSPGSPLDWQSSAWGTNTETFSYLSSGYDDTNSVNVNMTSYSSGDAKWFFNPQLVNKDTQYRYSEYYKSTVQTQIMAVFDMSDGTIEYQYIGLPDTANNWTNFTTTFSIPLGTANMTIYHLINQVGSLTTDDFNMTPYTPSGFKEPLLTLTFDDGYTSTYKYGYPLLKKYGYDSTQFIITDLIGQSGYMTRANIKTLYNARQEIASHTVTHSDLTQETATALTNELSQSATTLKSIIGIPVTDMAYPYGLYNTNVINAVKTYYSGGARGVEDGLNSKDNFNAYDIKVQNIFLTTTKAQVVDWIKQAQATDTWLVLVYHSVDPNTSSPIDGDQYNVTPAELSSDLAAIKASGIKVETMKSALSEVESQL